MKRWMTCAAAVLLLFGSRAEAGAGFWSSTGPYGGVINDLLINPTTPAIMYASTNGGFFRSVDAGVSWSRAENGLSGNRQGMPAMMDRDAPNTLYVVSNDGRMFRTTDGGDNWSPTGYMLPSGYGLVQMADVPGLTNSFYVAVTFGDALAAGTGIFYTSDGGATFAAAGTGLPVQRSFRTVSVDPTNANNVLAGTEGYSAVGMPAQPSIYRSTDGGLTWNPVLTGGTAETALRVDDVRFGAANNVYALISQQLYRSTNSGGTWSGPLALTTPAAIRGVSVLPDPSSAAVVLVGTTTGGIVKSIDGGITLSTTLNAGLSPNASYTDVLSSASVPAQALRIIASPNYPAAGSALWVASNGGGLYKSSDNGVTWSSRVLAGDLITVLFSNDGLAAANIRSVAVHPNPATFSGGQGQRIFAGYGDLITASPGMYRSNNAGALWGSNNSGLRASNIRSITIDPTTAGTTAGALATTVMYASGRSAVQAGAGYRNGGIYKSTDGGTTWANINNGLPTRFSGGVTFADLGTVRNIVLNPRSCASPPPGGGFCGGAGSPGPLNQVFATANGFSQPDGSGGSVMNFRVVRSNDGGANWVASDTGLPPSTISPVFERINPIGLVFSPSDANTMYLSTYEEFDTTAGSPTPVDRETGVFKSTDGGLSWAPVNAGLPRRAGFAHVTYDVLALAIHPTNGNILWATVIDFGVPSSASIYKTTDGGLNWFASATGIEGQADIRALLVDPNAPNTIYASGAGSEANPGSVYKSEDGGANWHSISVGLPADAALALALDPFNSTVLHAGTNAGVWTIEQVPDFDHDGVPDATENNAPNGGDGNGDGTADATQGDVGSAVVLFNFRAPEVGGGFFTSDVISGSGGACSQAVDVQAQLAARHGRDYFPDRVHFYSYPRDLAHFEITDCAHAVVDITFHGADFNQYGWAFRFFGPQTPGMDSTLGWYDFSSRAQKVAANKWRLTLDANQFGSYRPLNNSILFEGGPACFEDRAFRSGFEDAEPQFPNACQ